ncbi:1-deoxy-D-xylulose-5-phosphate synthase [Luminiphilus syltensis NOR5-1B]|uniref:1-deoxy-D-xylulose-5-phosphate synthase n=1 Tax=Luminiphilus syltensis NOR5-1B TaxID=565045 RepID=B8KWB8_9GAMM|nr:1-deoxy-D-xylulose-5-phosphate synthase [Luminiphilus syltensis]EED34559.1 1-deoxy-D-xylulose-5-phosphate synthase [Luminiphilus syltensis NOR5-1B]
MQDQLPTTTPDTPLLEALESQQLDIRQLTEPQLLSLADEVRRFLLFTVSQTGGHFGAGLGVVELTIALHHVLNTPHDRIVWDVGHQTYPHKILTGRRAQMHTMRQAGGLSGFPKRSESPFDTFGVGHSSTSVSAGMGMALAATQQGIKRRTVAVIGDGAITGGMAFEALAHAGHVRPNLLIVLNDNQMSIGHNTGGLATYFAKIWASRAYISLREGSKKLLENVRTAWEVAKRTEEHMKSMVAPGTLFEELGFNYIGPLDGHDLPQLVQALGNMTELSGPQLLHIRTVKGKGYSPAEADPVGYHALNKLEKSDPSVPPKPPMPKPPKYQDVFGQWLCDIAAVDPLLIGITPAMCEGSGMVTFARDFPDRYYDVAIAEQHAVTLAAGMACDGLKPVVAIYSTFLQRAYDQLIHDVALQELDVTFALDRAGLVGQDGATHHGVFDLSYLRCVPNMIIAAPADENECRQLLYTAYQHPGAAAVRYPRGNGIGVPIESEMSVLPVGKGRRVREGEAIAIVNFGVLLPEALVAAEQLNATVVDMRWVKPLDEALLEALASTHELLITVEENMIAGGAGSGVAEWLAANGLQCRIKHVGIGDEFIEQASQQQNRDMAGLNAAAILDAAAPTAPVAAAADNPSLQAIH